MCNFAHYQGEIMDIKKMSIEELTLWNENAFHLLYKNFYKALVNYAFQFINNDAASEDIVQGLFSQIWEKSLILLQSMPLMCFCIPQYGINV